MELNLSINQRFKVEILGAHYNAEIIAINKYDTDREFGLKITDYFIGTDKKSDTFIEVERLWFTGNPKRKITMIQSEQYNNHISQLTLQL